MLRHQYKGRRRDFGLGPVHDVSLAEARVAAMEIRKMVRAGLDPVEQRGLKRPSRASRPRSRQVQHRQAMPYSDVPAFMAKLTALTPSVGRDAPKLTVLTATRSGEVRNAVWGEFDLENAVWSIPAERMKMKEGHVIPLAPAAVALMRRLHAEQLALDGEVKPDRLIFTHYGARAISDVTMLKALRDMGIEGITVHGFRSSFADWAAEQTHTAKAVVEKALAHKVPNAVEAAYRRTGFFDKRRVLMDRWAEIVFVRAKVRG